MDHTLALADTCPGRAQHGNERAGSPAKPHDWAATLWGLIAVLGRSHTAADETADVLSEVESSLVGEITSVQLHGCRDFHLKILDGSGAASAAASIRNVLRHHHACPRRVEHAAFAIVDSRGFKLSTYCCTSPCAGIAIAMCKVQ